MEIKQIFDEISNESSTNKKLDILRKYKDNETLRKVLYLIESPRVKFYIKQVPQTAIGPKSYSWKEIFSKLELIYNREVTGDKAKEVLIELLANSSINDEYIITRIIEKKSKIGMGGTQINKVWPGLIEETPYMGAKPFTTKLANKILDHVCCSQVKMDGRYCNIYKTYGDVILESRQGEVTNLGPVKLLDAISKLPDGVYNGELTIPKIPRYTSNGIIASVISINKKEGKDKDKAIKKFEEEHGSFLRLSNSIIFTCWDTITINEYHNAHSHRMYLNRFQDLQKLPFSHHFQLVEHKFVQSLSEALAHFNECLQKGEEGTILKSMGGEWVDGKPNWQLKLKLEMTVEMRIIDFHYGTKGTKNEDVISALKVASKESLVICKVPGITEKDMLFITQNINDLRGTIISVKCNGLSQNEKGEFSLLHPRLEAFRDDKKVANTYKEIVEIEKSAKQLI